MKARKITFVPATSDTRLAFHLADGSEVVIDAKTAYTTDVASEIAYLDESVFVKRKPARDAEAGS